MNKSFLLLCVVCLLFVLSFSRAEAEEADNSRYDIIAEKFVDALKRGDRDFVSGQIDPAVASQLKAERLIAAFKSALSKYGGVKMSYPPRKENFSHYKLVFLPRRFDKVWLDFKVVISRENSKVSGFFIVPHKKGYSRPSYVIPEKYRETGVRFGLPRWKLWGRLALPAGKEVGKGPVPGLVLVHGSGTMDMDESVGSNKPFLDLAGGLASSGIAVLRYTKRTKQYKLGSREILGMTVKDEVVDDVVQAVACLKKQKGIDPDNIFVLGHSMGGMLIPRIDRACPGLRGYISLAGSNISLPAKLVAQYEYLASIGDVEARKKLPGLKEEMKKISSLKEGDENRIYMGASTTYWADLNSYRPLEEMKKLKKPVLFLQGGRDYQVTASGDFKNWRDALESKPNSSKPYQFKLYPNLNHLFITGKGKSTPSEYFQYSGNVSQKVIADIATWIKRISLH